MIIIIFLIMIIAYNNNRSHRRHHHQTSSLDLRRWWGTWCRGVHFSKRCKKLYILYSPRYIMSRRLFFLFCTPPLHFYFIVIILHNVITACVCVQYTQIKTHTKFWSSAGGGSVVLLLLICPFLAKYFNFLLSSPNNIVSWSPPVFWFMHASVFCWLDFGCALQQKQEKNIYNKMQLSSLHSYKTSQVWPVVVMVLW